MSPIAPDEFGARSRGSENWILGGRLVIEGSAEMAERIIEIETFVCTMPKRRDWTQHGMEKTLEHRVLLRLRTSDGVEGWGEATSLAQWGGIEGRYYGETVTTVTHIIHDLFAPALFQ